MLLLESRLYTFMLAEQSAHLTHVLKAKKRDECVNRSLNGKSSLPPNLFHHAQLVGYEADNF